MAAVLSRPPLPRTEEQKRFGTLFRRQVAPKLKELEAERQRLRQHYMTILVALGALLGIGLVLLWPLGPKVALLSALALGVLGLVVLQRLQLSFEKRLRAAVMPALCAAIGAIEHTVGSAPGLDFVALEELGLLPRHNRRRIDDVFAGRHRDTGFIVAEATLRQRGGTRRRSTRTRFRGLIFAISTPREVPARILIARDAGLIGNGVMGWVRRSKPLQRVSLPHPEFERHFELYADRPEAALQTVTPGVCDALVALAEAHRGQPLQAAFLGRQFYLTMPKRRDQFRLGSLFRPLDRLEEDAGRVLHDVQIVHRVIDALHGDRRALATR